MFIRKWLKSARLVLLISNEVARSALKEKMMYGFLLLALLFILMANVPFMVEEANVFEGQSPEVAAVQIGFVAINIFTILIAVFVSVNTLQNFLDRERLVLFLAKPVKRWQILEGIILGLFKMIFLNWFLMTAGVWLVVVSQTKALAFYIWPGMSITALMSLLYVTLIVFFYCIMPNAASGVLAVLVMIAGFGSSLAKELFLKASYPYFIKASFLLTLNLLPKINDLWGISMNELKLFVLDIAVFPVLLHTILLIAILNLACVWRFRRFCQL
ncbi:MAG: hypothetical protein ABIC68_05480 [Candidatus Omnitrophota bacterium]